MQECKDCIYIKTLTDKVQQLEQDVAYLNTEVAAIKTDAAVNREKIDSICSSIARIEKSIEKIAEKIEQRDQRPQQLMWTVIGGVVVALIIAGLKFIQ